MFHNVARLSAMADSLDNLSSLIDRLTRIGVDGIRNSSAKGWALLELSAAGSELTENHIEAAIAAAVARALKVLTGPASFRFIILC